MNCFIVFLVLGSFSLSFFLNNKWKRWFKLKPRLEYKVSGMKSHEFNGFAFFGSA